MLRDSSSAQINTNLAMSILSMLNVDLGILQRVFTLTKKKKHFNNYYSVNSSYATLKLKYNLFSDKIKDHKDKIMDHLD